jgi:branched-chain amino acid transport system permease protein
MQLGRISLVIVLAAAGFLLPYVLGGTAAVFNTVVVIAIFSVMTYGVDIILSDLGEVSLAHTVFFAVGAYAVGVLGVGYNASSWETLAVAVIAALLIAVVLAATTYKAQGFVFSLVTYAAGIVCLNIAQNWDFLGGSDGIVGVPPLDLSIGPLALRAADNRTIWPYAYVLLIGTIYFVHRFRRSSIGRSAFLVHQNRRLAMMTGAAPRWIRMRVLMLSAVVTSLGGWLYSYQRAYVGPDLFESYFLILMLTAAVLPGRRVLVGPVIGTAILMIQKAYLSFGGDFDKIVLGGVLVVVLSAYPRGLIGAWDSLAEALSRRARQGAARKPPQITPRSHHANHLGTQAVVTGAAIPGTGRKTDPRSLRTDC